MAENKCFVSLRFFVSAPRSGITFILVIIGDEVGKGFFLPSPQPPNDMARFHGPVPCVLFGAMCLVSFFGVM